MQTFAVVDVPPGVDYVHIGARAFTRIGVKECEPRFLRALGAAHTVQEQTAYTWAFFAPTLTQRRAGARWIRCDVTLSATTIYGDNAFAVLPYRGFPMIGSRPVTDSVRRCLADGDPNSWTVCARAHVARADQVFVWPSSTRPTATTVGKAAATRCPGKRWTYPAPYRWRAGVHVITCYSVTTH